MSGSITVGDHEVKIDQGDYATFDDDGSEIVLATGILDEHAHIPGDGINFTLAEQGRAEETIQLLALPYADHHDYREGWKP